MKRALLRRFLDEYGKHFALNIGQALQGVRYLHSHPDIDVVAERGTLHHVALSIRLRTKRVVNDVFFAVLPPQSHHSREELSQMATIPATRWFQYGYCAWRFDDDGRPKETLEGVDRRWDPRCAETNDGDGIPFPPPSLEETTRGSE